MKNKGPKKISKHRCLSVDLTMTFLTSSGSSSARYPDGPDDGADCSMAPIVPSEDDDANASMAPIGPPVWVVEPNNTLASNLNVNAENYFTSCDPHHDIYTFCYWQIFWHSIWHIFWHSIWHISWHFIWHIFWHSI